MEKISILFWRYLELKLQFCYYIYFQIVQTGFFELFSTFPTLLTCSPLEDVEDVQTRGLKVGGGIVGLGDEQLVLSAIIHRLKHVRHLASRWHKYHWHTQWARVPGLQTLRHTPPPDRPFKILFFANIFFPTTNKNNPAHARDKNHFF